MSRENVPADEDAAGHAPPARLTLFLDHVGRSLRRAAAVEGTVVGVSGALLAFLAGTFASLTGGSVGAIALTELVVFTGVVAFVIVRYARFLGKALHAPREVAAWLDAAIARHGLRPPEQTALLSAVELSAARGHFGESELLANAAILEATHSALALDSDGLVKKEAWTSLRQRLLTLSATAIVLGGSGLVFPKHVQNAVLALSTLSRFENPLHPPPPEPRLGDFRITYRYPAYSERPPQSVVEPHGDIRALPGTEVVIETSARDDLTQGTLLVTYGAETEQQQAQQALESTRVNVEVEGRHLKATMVISRAGRYRFSLKNESGQLLEERRGHTIELELDEPPEITQLEPTESPLEVNEKDRLSISFEAHDDFGLGDVYFAWRVMGSTREGKEKLTSAAHGSKRWAGSAPLELSPLALKPGDRVAYTLEARDNDTVNGPKLGASMTRELRVYSKASHHEEVLALQEKALEELVQLLGDHLEVPFDPKPEVDPYKAALDTADKQVTRAEEADPMLVKVVQAVKKDPLGRPAVADAFEAARADLSRDTRREKAALTQARRLLTPKKAPEKPTTQFARGMQDQTIASLEKNVVYLADLLNDQRLIDAEALTKELREAQQALKKALEDYKASPDPEKRKQLMTAIQEIKQRINDIMQQLSKMKGTIPQDFVNQDALKTKESEASMDNVQKMIEDGDLDGAMSELDHLLNQTEKMMSQLQSGREEMGSREYSEVQETAERMWNELQEVEREQRELASKTEKISKDVQERMKQRMGDPKAFVEKQKKRLEQIGQALEKARPGSHFLDGDNHDQAERRIEDAMKALEAHDFGAAKEMVEGASQLLEQLEQDASRRADQSRKFGDMFSGGKAAEQAEHELRRARPILEDVKDDIEKLMPPPESLLSEDERQQLERQRERQDALQKRAQKIGEDLDRIGQELPIVGPETKGMVSEASGAMGEASQKMSQGDAPGALGQERKASEALGRLRQELEKMGSKGQGGGQGGVPLPFGQQQQSKGGEEQGNGRSDDPRHVEIPKPEQFKAPAEFREDILEAAKQGTVEDYREAVRRYYEELVK